MNETIERADWDHSTDARFYDYYASQSASPETVQRFLRVKETILRLLAGVSSPGRSLRIADIGCGAGAQAAVWAAEGHRVRAIDISERLVSLARERAHDAGLTIEFDVGSATSLPWSDSTIDVCLLPELLEHVADWQRCLNEAVRVVAPDGALYLSTTNVLCPSQQEFNLPMYSWYPSALKRYCERIAVSTHPGIANYARYPAVNWFSFYGLRRFLEPLGFRCFDRFDLIDDTTKDPMRRAMIRALRGSSALRALGHVVTPSVVMIAVKSRR